MTLKMMFKKTIFYPSKQINKIVILLLILIFNAFIFSPITAGIDGASLVEDPSGGVLLVGGFSQEDGNVLDTILRLSASNGDWELLPQTLETPRFGHTAFFVPNKVVNCN